MAQGYHLSRPIPLAAFVPLAASTIGVPNAPPRLCPCIKSESRMASATGEAAWNGQSAGIVALRRADAQH
jgi:hypothetical protein